MNIYNYHPNTKEFLSVSAADLDPLETQKKRKEVYLIPANATVDKPPIPGENKAVIYVNNSWIEIDDYRGKEYYKENGEKKIIQKLGETVPSDALLEPPPLPPPTYIDLRRAEYPPILEQLENITHALQHLRENGIAIGQDGNKQVDDYLTIKNKYPKN